jgi:ATP-dependent Lon protease
MTRVRRPASVTDTRSVVALNSKAVEGSFMTRYEPYATRFPLLPLKNVVIFPRNIVTLQVGRPRSIQAIEEAINHDRRIVVVAHRDPEIDDPLASDVYSVGTLAEVVQSERQQATTLQVVLEGICRVRLSGFDTSRPFFNVASEEMTGR